MIKTDKYKTVTIRLSFHSPIIKEEITIRNVLSDILLQSTNKYSTKRDLIVEAEDLYAADIYNSTRRVGNYIMTNYTLQVLNDKYTEEGNLEKAINFLSEIIFNPDIEGKSFREEKLSHVINNCNIAISSIKEDTSEYAHIRLKEVYDEKNPSSYRITGYKEDLNLITPSNLYKYYKNMLDNDFVDIYVVGDIDFDETLKMIKKYIRFHVLKKKKIPYEISNIKIHNRLNTHKEHNLTSQSQLGVLCTITKLSDYEMNYPLVLANIILGGGTDSRLFQEVREKNSLCYSIYSSYSRLDNMITISAGIEKDNYRKTVDLINKTLKNLQHGKFTTTDILKAKELYNSSITSIEDNPMNIIREFVTEDIMQVPSYEERKLIMSKVTKKEIISSFRKIKIDTIFLLEGDSE